MEIGNRSSMRSISPTCPVKGNTTVTRVFARAGSAMTIGRSA